MWCTPIDTLNFWKEWQVDLCRDRMLKGGVTEPSRVMIEEVLYYIKTVLEKNDYSLKDFNLPEPDVNIIEAADLSRLIQEGDYDVDSYKIFVDEHYSKLNDGQKKVVDEVWNSICNKLGKIFCLNAYGGTGKNLCS